MRYRNYNMLFIFVIVVYSLCLVVMAISLSWPHCIMFLQCERYSNSKLLNTIIIVMFLNLIHNNELFL